MERHWDPQVAALEERVDRARRRERLLVLGLAAITAVAVTFGSGVLVLLLGGGVHWHAHRRRVTELAERYADAERLLHAWRLHVPAGDELGPTYPEDGWRVAVASKEVVDDGRRGHVRFAFRARVHEFAGGEWVLADARPLLSGPVRSMGEPVERIAEDWVVFQHEVDELNRASWSRERERREEEAFWRTRREHERRLLAEL